MRLVLFQTLFMGTYLLFLVVVRAWAHERSQRQAVEERARQEALEREWRVGIPYDPKEP